MAYGTPTDPVAGTVITVAYAVTNLLDPIRWLRTMTGGSDPPGSNYWLQSASTTAVSWVARGAAVLAAIGYTPVNKAGDDMIGTLTLSNSIGLQMRTSAAVARLVAYMDVVNQIWYGHTSHALVLTGTLLQWWNGSALRKIWHEDNDGAGSGLDADKLDGSEGAAYALLNSSPTFTGTIGAAQAAISGLIAAGSAAIVGLVQASRFESTVSAGTAPMTIVSNTEVANLNAQLHGGNLPAAYATAGHSHTSAGRIATGVYSGNGAATQTISTLPFTPSLVFVQKVAGAGGNLSSLFGPHDAPLFLAGSVVNYGTGTVLAPNGFTVSLATGLNNGGSTYSYVAIG